MTAPRRSTDRPSDDVSLREAAALKSVSIATLRRRVADGTLPAHRLGPKLIRIRRADLEAMCQPVPTVGSGGAHARTA